MESVIASSFIRKPHLSELSTFLSFCTSFVRLCDKTTVSGCWTIAWHMRIFGRNGELCLVADLSLLLVCFLRECHPPHLQGLNCIATVRCSGGSGQPYERSHLDWSRALIKLPLEVKAYKKVPVALRLLSSQNPSCMRVCSYGFLIALYYAGDNFSDLISWIPQISMRRRRPLKPSRSHQHLHQLLDHLTITMSFTKACEMLTLTLLKLKGSCGRLIFVFYLFLWSHTFCNTWTRTASTSQVFMD